MHYGQPFPFLMPAFGGLIAALVAIALLWTIVWKGLALWHAARNNQKVWFVVLLIVNTLGILEIIYLAFFRKDENNTTTTPTPAPATESSSAPTV